MPSIGLTLLCHYLSFTKEFIGHSTSSMDSQMLFQCGLTKGTIASFTLLATLLIEHTISSATFAVLFCGAASSQVTLSFYCWLFHATDSSINPHQVTPLAHGHLSNFVLLIIILWPWQSIWLTIHLPSWYLTFSAIRILHETMLKARLKKIEEYVLCCPYLQASHVIIEGN